jgi:hypothetical protein
VRWVDPDALGLDAGGPAELLAGFPESDRLDALNAALAQSADLGGLAEYDRRVADIRAGRYRAVEWPWPRLGQLTQALVPGTVTILCGTAGDGKSFWLLQAVLHWLAAGETVALFELEEDAPFWLGRALALLEGERGFADAAFPERRPADHDEGRARNGATLRLLADALTVARRRPPTPRLLVEWVRRHAERGCRVVCVDPITAVMPAADQHLRDFELMMAAKRVAVDCGCSLVFVTHPKQNPPKGADFFGRMAGGASFARFSQTVLWPEFHKTNRQAVVSLPGGEASVGFNRTLHVAKARNGSGARAQIAFDVSPETLRWRELGVVVGE